MTSDPALSERALQALEDMESTIPCGMMCGDGWCEENCDSSYGGAIKKCWAHYLTNFNKEEQRMKIKLDEGAFKPVRAHDTDAGLDLRAVKDVLIRANSSAVIDTGVHIELPHGCAGLLVSKSGLNVNNDLTSTGLIDEGYTGEIKVKLYNHGTDDYQVHVGDKVSQLVVFPVSCVDVEVVDELNNNTDRGESGFGSSGR